MKGTPITEEIFEYVVERFALSEVELLQAMRSRAEAAGVPMIMISEEQAKFVGMFLKAMNARRVLDVGTLFGYSAAVMARAIGPAGSVTSLEYSEMHAKVARENFVALGLSNVDVLVGPATETMKTLPDNSFDFILIDADKVNYVNYLTEAKRLVRNGGVIAGDNALAWGKIADPALPKTDPDYVSVNAVRAFNDAFAADTALFGIIVPVGDGLAVATVTK
jgi:predicted O-methyltransferase YrrM